MTPYRSPTTRAIARTIVALAPSLGLQVTMEGSRLSTQRAF